MNGLKALDLTTLFDKLEEHEQEFTCLEKHEKEYGKKMNKDKSKDKVEDKKPVALKTYSLKSSKYEQSDYETRSDNDSNDEDMGLFVKRYHGYYLRCYVS